jgi:glycosyltransferase involved in cell wall biosynthesis
VSDARPADHSPNPGRDPAAPVAVTLIVPCYNEQAVVERTASELVALIQQQCAAGRMSDDSRVLFIDDGSGDRTWALLEALAAAHPGRVGAVRLARNAGHQYALLAGLTVAPGEALVTIDADLQDDPAAIPAMIDLYRGGHDVVYGVRERRVTDTAYKRLSAAAFYSLMRRMGADVIDNHADFRLMSRRAVEALLGFGEANLFLRGVVRLVGLPAAEVRYDRRARFAGDTKYSTVRMAALAIEGITSFSVAPLRVISALGLATSLFAIAVTVWVLVVALTNPAAVPGWASTVLPITFIAGIQILSLGVIGEYVGKIYLETKRRPRFIVERVIGLEPEHPAIDRDAR